MKQRSAIKTDLFAANKRKEKIDRLGDPLTAIEEHIDFVSLASEVDRVSPRPESLQGGRPPFPTETMVRILVLKRSRASFRRQIHPKSRVIRGALRFLG